MKNTDFLESRPMDMSILEQRPARSQMEVEPMESRLSNVKENSIDSWGGGGGGGGGGLAALPENIFDEYTELH